MGQNLIIEEESLAILRVYCNCYSICLTQLTSKRHKECTIYSISIEFITYQKYLITCILCPFFSVYKFQSSIINLSQCLISLCIIILNYYKFKLFSSGKYICFCMEIKQILNELPLCRVLF